MRKLVFLPAFALALAACTPADPIDELEIPDFGTGSVLTEGAIEGEFCGGIAAIECAPGLECVLDGDYPDAGGTCEQM